MANIIFFFWVICPLFLFQNTIHFVIALFTSFEVVKKGVAKSVQILTSLAKMVDIILYFVSPGYRIFKNLCMAYLQIL